MAENNCVKCGKPLKPGDKFCPECGTPAGSPKAMAIPRRDHYFILGVLILVVLIYIGYVALKPGQEPVPQGSPHTTQGEPSRDVDAFMKNLPTDHASLVSMGDALMNRGEYELAAVCYERALDQEPDDVDVMVDLGACEHSLGMNEEALGYFKRALAIDSTHQVAKFNLGIVYYTLGDYQQAADSWEKLLKDNPPQDLKKRTQELLEQIKGLL